MSWKIVIVEDEDILRNGLIHTISWEDYGFFVAGDADNGRQGLELIQEIQPDVVFTDIRMAQMDGLTMAEKIYEWNPEIQLVFISGYDEFEYAMRALKVGAAEYILKPVQLEQVIETLEKLSAKLSQRQSQKKEYSKLKQLEEYSLGSIRQEFYRAVIHGAKQKCHEKNYESMIPKEEREGYFSAIIVVWKDFAALSMNADYIGIMEMDHRFEEMLTAVLGDDKEYTMVRGNAGERILVLWGEDREKLCRERDHLSRRLLENKHSDCSFEVNAGTAARYVSGLYQSYLEARKMLEERYLEEWSQIIQAENEVPENVNFINYHNGDLMKAVKSGNSEEIVQECSRLEKELGNRKVVSHIHLILIVTSIFEELARLAQEAEQIIGETAGATMEDYQKIISKGTRAELLKGLKEYCLALGACFDGAKDTKIQSSLKRAISYMNSEFGNEGLTIGEVAKNSYISSSYLSMLLKKDTGKTFIEYLTDIRMEHARKLLQETSMKNYEVAQACGFANATYFSTVFKSMHGISPSQYRKE
ncbi:MAG: response regulator [Lachnospiraceae bacterium]|nr:response regulator [Lachnospiraceae bacterium]